MHVFWTDIFFYINQNQNLAKCHTHNKGQNDCSHPLMISKEVNKQLIHMALAVIPLFT